MSYKFNPFTGTFDLVNDASASAVWGGITGTLSNQTDLQAALDAISAQYTNIDGGSAVSTYLLAQVFDGGGA